jgi:hypothetical protein
LEKNQNQRTAGSDYSTNIKEPATNKWLYQGRFFLIKTFPKKKFENHGYIPKLVFGDFFHPNQVSENIYLG